jgi:hypothetical protein
MKKMKFDPKKIMDTALDQVQQSGNRSHEQGNGTEIDDVLYKMSRDLEELRIKNREITDRISDLDMQFNHLKNLINRRGDRRDDRRY